MATKPRSCLRMLRRLCVFFAVASGVAAVEVAWLGWNVAGFAACCCVSGLIAWLVVVGILTGACVQAADGIVLRSGRYDDAAIRRAMDEMEGTLSPIEQDVHEAVVARLRVVRPGVFAAAADEYRYSDPAEGFHG